MVCNQPLLICEITRLTVELLKKYYVIRQSYNFSSKTFVPKHFWNSFKNIKEHIITQKIV